MISAQRAISKLLFLPVFFLIFLFFTQTAQADISNVALNKPVTAGNATYFAEINSITNGNRDGGDYTALIGNNPSLTIDLGSQYVINKVNLEMLFQAGRQRVYHNVKVKISSDKTNWTTVFESAVSGEFITSQSGKDISFSPKTARYVMVSSNGGAILNEDERPSDNNWIEVSVYGVTAPTLTPMPTPIMVSAPTSCGSVTIGGQNFERIPIKFYATYVNGREEVTYATGTNTPYSYWEISQDEFIRIAKQRFNNGVSQYDQALQQNPSILQPAPWCSKSVWKDGVPWTIDSVKSALLLASDPNMCIIGGTASAPLYVPCISPAHDAYLQTLATKPPQTTLENIAEQLTAIQEAVNGIEKAIKEKGLKIPPIKLVFTSDASNSTADVTVFDTDNQPVVSLTLSAMLSTLDLNSLPPSTFPFTVESDFQKFRKIVVTGLYFNPVSGEALGIIEAITGKSLSDGSELALWERGFGVIPFVGVLKDVKPVVKLVRIVRVGEKILPEGLIAIAKTVSSNRIVLAGGDRQEILSALSFVKEEPGYLDVVIHGNSKGFSIENVMVDGVSTSIPVDPKTLASALKNMGMGGRPIRLMACDVGTICSIGGDALFDAVAQSLANEIGKQVLAPNGILYLTSTSEVGYKILKKDGTLGRFVPYIPL